jgi:hypothetical protein
MSALITSWGILFPASILSTEWFAVLSAFVAINTVRYVALAVAKVLARGHPSELWHRRDRRRTNRSIHPTPGDRVDV